MKVSQTNTFKKKVKKIHKNEKELLDKEIKKIVKKPSIGDEKKGDLKGIFVYKYKFKINQMMIAYKYSKTELILIAYGTHENFYKNLKIR